MPSNAIREINSAGGQDIGPESQGSTICPKVSASLVVADTIGSTAGLVLAAPIVIFDSADARLSHTRRRKCAIVSEEASQSLASQKIVIIINRAFEDFTLS
jgi:hypothetical protein